MVFQHFNLFPHMTALENVTLAPVRVRRRRAAARRAQRGVELLDRGSGSPTSSTPTRSRSPAASSSGWRSPGRWRWSRS